NRLINFYAWVEANHHMLQIHWKASKTLDKIRSEDTGFDDTILRLQFYRRISLAIKRSKNDPKSILRIPADTTFALFSRKCSEEDCKSYLPHLSMLLLLSLSPDILDHMPIILLTVPKGLSFEDFSGYF